MAHASTMEHSQQGYGQEIPYSQHHSPWLEQHAFHGGTPSSVNGHHSSPGQEYHGYASLHGSPLEPHYTSQQHCSHHPSHPHASGPRASYPQLQPIVVPPWPSMLANGSTPNGYVSGPQAAHHVNNGGSQPPPQLQPGPAPPGSSGPGPQLQSPLQLASHQSTPRRTLTDADRRRMCQYHEEHPNKKQTEIGEIFGVERSTVSKVLRQKEKYLRQDDGSRSPIRKPKGKFPDVEKALMNWAKNQESKGFRLSDEMIREQARFFSTTVGSPENQLKINSSSWLEKFKQKHNLMGFKARKGSIDNAMSPTAKSDHPSPHQVDGDVHMRNTGSARNSLQQERNGGPAVYHSRSNASLSSAFTDHAPSSTFSPTNTTSPLFTPDSAEAPYFPSSVSNQAPHQAAQQQQQLQQQSQLYRARSQTLPTSSAQPQAVSSHEGQSQYISPPPSSQAVTPKLHQPHVSSPPSAQSSTGMPPPPSIPHHPQQQQQQHAQAMTFPPAYAAHYAQNQAAFDQAPTEEDARRALELILAYFSSTSPTPSHRSGSMSIDANDVDGSDATEWMVAVNKLMNKLRLRTGSMSHSTAGSESPGRMGGAVVGKPGPRLMRIPEVEFGGGDTGSL